MIYKKRKEWVVWFQVRQALSGLPRPQAIQVKTVSGADYNYHSDPLGRLRQCQIMIGLYGCGYFTRNGKSWRIEPGMAILYDFKEPFMSYSMPPDYHGEWQWLRFGFYNTDGAVEELCKAHPAPFNISLDSDLVKRLMHYQRLSDHEPIISAGAGASLVAGVLEDIQRAMQDQNDQASTRLSESLEEWLQQHVGIPGIRIGEAAEILNVSQEHLTRCFSKTYGCTPKERLEQLNLRLACRRISEEQNSIGEIAAELGYTSSSHFARRFKLQYGITPGEWRRKAYPPLA